MIEGAGHSGASPHRTPVPPSLHLPLSLPSPVYPEWPCQNGSCRCESCIDPVLPIWGSGMVTWDRSQRARFPAHTAWTCANTPKRQLGPLRRRWLEDSPQRPASVQLRHIRTLDQPHREGAAPRDSLCGAPAHKACECKQRSLWSITPPVEGGSQQTDPSMQSRSWKEAEWQGWVRDAVSAQWMWTSGSGMKLR